MRRFFTDRTPPDLATTYNQLAPDWLGRWSMLESRLLGDQWRRDLINHLHGDVLELGIAAGDTLLRLSTQAHDVTSYTGIDISPGMINEARRAANQLHLQVHLHVASAEDLGAFTDAQFDTVAASLVFCTIADVSAALAEVTRVLKPGGTFVLIEHVLSPVPPVAWLQRLIAPVHVRQMGCHLDRETVRTLQDHGFHIRQQRRRIMSILRFVLAVPST